MVKTENETSFQIPTQVNCGPRKGKIRVCQWVGHSSRVISLGPWTWVDKIATLSFPHLPNGAIWWPITFFNKKQDHIQRIRVLQNAHSKDANDDVDLKHENPRNLERGHTHTFTHYQLPQPPHRTIYTHTRSSVLTVFVLGFTTHAALCSSAAASMDDVRATSAWVASRSSHVVVDSAG